jgi:hypothetical protein
MGMSGARIAILLDGGYVTKRLEGRLKRFPTAEDISSLCQTLMTVPCISRYELYRIYFYDCEPFSGSKVHR